MNPDETTPVAGESKPPDPSLSPVPPPAPANTATQVIQAGIKYRLVSQWIGLTLFAVLYILVFIPILVVFAPRVLAGSVGAGLLMIVCFGLLPPLVMYYGVWMLRRRNWASTHMQTPAPVAVQPQAPQVGPSPTPGQPIPVATVPTSAAATATEPKLELAIPGIMKVGVTAYSPMGLTVEVQHPENALIVTDQGLCFVYIPMPGADNQFMNTQYITSQFNKKGIEQQLEALIASQPVSQILAMDTRNWVVPYTDISKLHLSNFQRSVKIERANGDTRSYMIGKKQYWEPLKQLLAAKGYSG